MDFVNFFQPALWIKIITLIVIGFYMIFTLVVFTQVKTMSKILHLPQAEIVLKILSIVHIALAISLFVMAVVIL